jgi:hypothetical protein
MNSTQGFFESLRSAVRENPLSAALIGGGALWLLVGDERLKSAAKSATAAASPILDSGVRNLRTAASEIKRTVAPPTAPEMSPEKSYRVGDTLHDLGGSASETLSGAAERIEDQFHEGLAYARKSVSNLGNPLPGSEAFAQAQSSLTEVLERQPLIIGMVGLAIGAAIAGAFRASEIENQWVGELSDDLKNDLNTRAGSVSHSLREASDTFKSELGDAGAEAADRLRQAGRDAADAAREKARSS